MSLQSGVSYLLRIDHKSGVPRPVLGVVFEGPGTGGRTGITPYLTLPD